MIGSVGGATSLLSSVYGSRLLGSSVLGQGGFGPAAIVDFGASLFGNVPGYTALANSSAALIGALQAQLLRSTSPTPIYSEKQAQQLNEIVGKAAVALNNGDFSEAKAQTQKLLQRDLNNPTAYHLLGRIASAECDSRTAIQYLQRAAELAPQSERISDDLFNARQLTRDDSDVLAVGSQLVRIRGSALLGVKLMFELAKRTPQQGQTYLRLAEGFGALDLPVQQLGALGVVLEEGSQDDLEELETKVRQFIGDNEPVGLAYSLLGRTQQKLGKFAEAIQSLETATAIAPEVARYAEELANVHATLGNQALGKGDLSAAQFRFEKARDLDPLNSDLKLGLGAVFVSQAKEKINLGLNTAARSLLGRATTMLGSDKALDGELAVAYFRLGERALADGLDGLARINFEDALKRNPELGGLKRMLSDIYRTEAQSILDAKPYADMTSSDFDTVTENFQKSFDLFPTRASYKSSLGTALDEYGQKLMNVNQNYEKALEMFGRARELFPNNTAYQSNYAQALNLKIIEDNA